MSESPADPIQTLTSWLRNARAATVFTGAGMSTESGLPDFRGSTGLFKDHRIEQLASPEGFRQHFPDYVEFYRWRIRGMLDHEPHEGHRVLARLQERGLIKGVITQNVDGYHALAGSTNVVELHGSLRVVRCQGCHDQRPAIDYLEDAGLTCACTANYRPGIVMFGEPMPRGPYGAALQMAEAADLLIVLGTTLTVYPAADLPVRTLARRGRVVIVNQTPTPLDGEAALVMRGPIKDTLVALEACL